MKTLDNQTLIKYGLIYKKLKEFLQKKKESKKITEWDCIHHQGIWDKMIELETDILLLKTL